MEGDKPYFMRRASEERLAAGRAESTAARNAHLDLAARYMDLAQAIGERDRMLGLRDYRED